MNGEKKLCIKLPTASQLNLPHVLHVAGIACLIFWGGVQTAAKNSPEVIKGWGDSADASALFGVVASFGAFAFNYGNQKQSQAAVDQAAKAPPVDAHGEMSGTHTLYTAVQQLGNDGQHDLAAKVVNLLADYVKGKEAAHA